MKKGAKMKVTMEFLDRKGFWHLFNFSSKKGAIMRIRGLHPQTESHWTSPNHVIVNQQYIKGDK